MPDRRPSLAETLRPVADPKQDTAKPLGVEAWSLVLERYTKNTP